MAVGAALTVAPALVVGPLAATAGAAPSCTNTASIGVGAPATDGTISAAGQVDCYQYFAKAGRAVRVRVVATGGALVPSTEVDGPTGSVVCGPASTNDQTCTSSVTGIQTIAIQDASGTSTGTYAVAIQTMARPLNCGFLSFGSPPNTGSINPGDIACFTFRAPAGSRLITRAVATSGSLTPSLEEINANGHTQCGPDASLEQSCRIVSGGNQTLFVTDAAGGGSGTFSVYAQQTNRTVTCSGIKFGKAKQSAITSAGQTNCYKFSGVTGHYMRLTVAGTSGSLVTDTEMIRPNGSTVCRTSSTPEQTCRLTTDGTHTIFVSDVTGQNTGNYTIYLQDLNAPLNCVPIQYGNHGDTHPDTIAFPGDENCYTFTGTAGTGAHLKVTSTGGTWTPKFEIIQPNGTDPNPGYCDINATDERCVLGISGTHMVLVRDASAKNTGTYDYSLTERTF